MSQQSPRRLAQARGISQDVFNYVKADTFWVLTQKLDNVSASISGSLFGLGLPAGPITAALSGECAGGHAT